MSVSPPRPLQSRDTSVFSRPLAVDEIPDEGMDLTITADPAECHAIADAIGLPAVAAVSADLHISRQRDGGRVQVAGTLNARITQVCVVSLEPFESDVTQEVEIAFAPTKEPLLERHARPRNERQAMRRAAELPIAPIGDDEADPPDPIVNGRIDLGAVACEFLTLALDFYPRKPGVHFSDVVIGEKDDPRPSAFAALERFKDRS